MRTIVSRRGLWLWLGVLAIAALLAGVFALSLERGSGGLQVLDDVQDFRSAFNGAPRAWRLVLLLSPTAESSREGARWLERVLADSRDLPLEVMIAWQGVEPGDTEEAARKAALLVPDPRVSHAWDPTACTGRWFYETGLAAVPALRDEPVNRRRGLVLDTFLLYGPRATWEEGLPAPEVAGTLSEGRSVLGEALLALLAAARQHR